MAILPKKNYKTINNLWYDPEIQDKLVGKDLLHQKDSIDSVSGLTACTSCVRQTLLLMRAPTSPYGRFGFISLMWRHALYHST